MNLVPAHVASPSSVVVLLLSSRRRSSHHHLVSALAVIAAALQSRIALTFFDTTVQLKQKQMSFQLAQYLVLVSLPGPVVLVVLLHLVQYELRRVDDPLPEDHHGVQGLPEEVVHGGLEAVVGRGGGGRC